MENLDQILKDSIENNKSTAFVNSQQPLSGERGAMLPNNENPIYIEGTGFYFQLGNKVISPTGHIMCCLEMGVLAIEALPNYYTPSEYWEDDMDQEAGHSELYKSYDPEYGWTDSGWVAFYAFSWDGYKIEAHQLFSKSYGHYNVQYINDKLYNTEEVEELIHSIDPYCSIEYVKKKYPTFNTVDFGRFIFNKSQFQTENRNAFLVYMRDDNHCGGNRDVVISSKDISNEYSIYPQELIMVKSSLKHLMYGHRLLHENEDWALFKTRSYMRPWIFSRIDKLTDKKVSDFYFGKDCDLLESLKLLSSQVYYNVINTVIPVSHYIKECSRNTNSFDITTKLDDGKTYISKVYINQYGTAIYNIITTQVVENPDDSLIVKGGWYRKLYKSSDIVKLETNWGYISFTKGIYSDMYSAMVHSIGSMLVNDVIDLQLNKMYQLTSEHSKEVWDCNGPRWSHAKYEYSTTAHMQVCFKKMPSKDLLQDEFIFGHLLRHIPYKDCNIRGNYYLGYNPEVWIDGRKVIGLHRYSSSNSKLSLE